MIPSPARLRLYHMLRLRDPRIPASLPWGLRMCARSPIPQKRCCVIARPLRMTQ